MEKVFGDTFVKFESCTQTTVLSFYGLEPIILSQIRILFWLSDDKTHSRSLTFFSEDQKLSTYFGGRKIRQNFGPKCIIFSPKSVLNDNCRDGTIQLERLIVVR